MGLRVLLRVVVRVLVEIVQIHSVEVLSYLVVGSAVDSVSGCIAWEQSYPYVIENRAQVVTCQREVQVLTGAPVLFIEKRVVKSSGDPTAPTFAERKRFYLLNDFVALSRRRDLLQLYFAVSRVEDLLTEPDRDQEPIFDRVQMHLSYVLV